MGYGQEKFNSNVTLVKIKNQFTVWDGQYGRFLPDDKNAKIIDIGCGYGGMVHWLNLLGFSEAEGIDINRDKIDTGQTLGIKNLHHGDAMSFLKGKENYYDAVFLIDTLSALHHEEVVDLISAVKRALKPNGSVVIKLVNSESPMAGRLRYPDFMRQVHFTEASIKKLILSTGFSSVGAYPLRPVIHGLKSLTRYILWRFIETTLKLYRVIETGSLRGLFTESIIVVGKK